MKNVQAETLKSNNGNLYGSVVSEEPEKNTVYHEPHEIILKRGLADLQLSSSDFKEYHSKF